MTTASAIGAASILAGIAAMQFALVLGAPWGAHVYGGRVAGPGEPLPTPFRVASLVAIALLLGAAWLVLARAGVVAPAAVADSVVHRGAWVVAGYLVLNTVANLASTSAIERWVLGAATAVAAAMAVLVAAS